MAFCHVSRFVHILSILQYIQFSKKMFEISSCSPVFVSVLHRFKSDHMSRFQLCVHMVNVLTSANVSVLSCEKLFHSYMVLFNRIAFYVFTYMLKQNLFCGIVCSSFCCYHFNL